MDKKKLLRFTIGLFFIMVVILESNFHGIHSLLMKRLDSAAKEYFGEETELVDASGSMDIYHTYSVHGTKKDVYFWAIGKNFWENNLAEQLMKLDAILEDGNISYRLVAVNRDMWENYYVLIKSTDGGKTWLEINGAPFGDSYYGEVEMIFQDESHGRIAGIYSDMEVNQYKKNVYVTEDGGKTFILKEEGQPR